MQRLKRDFPRLRNSAPNALIMHACIADFVHEFIPDVLELFQGYPQSGSRCLAYPLQREPHQGT